MSIRFFFVRRWPAFAIVAALALALAIPLSAQQAPARAGADANARTGGRATSAPASRPNRDNVRAGPGFHHPDDFKPPAPPPEAPGIRAYSSDIHDIFDQDQGAPAIAMTAARNGAYNGKIVLASSEAIKGVKASVSDLKAAAGADAIPASCIQVRYAAPLDSEKGGTVTSMGRDVLLEDPPAETGVAQGRAVLPVWVTVSVPKDAKPGQYAGQLSVEAGGKKLPAIPVKLTVGDWTVPDVQDWRTWIEMVESPDTLAVEYETPMWSAKHLELIAKSLRLISQSGSRMVYVPLVCHTNLGNEESMLRWVKKGESYEPDFTAVDKYLDIVQKNLGTPKIVCFWAWDAWMNPPGDKFIVIKEDDRPSMKEEKAKLAARAALFAKGVPVTAVDPATGKTEMVFIPKYTTPEGKALWAPVWRTLREKMKKRGLEGAMMLGCSTDWMPTKEDATILNELTGNLQWVSCSHHCAWRDRPEGGKNALAGVATVGLTTLALSFQLTINPELGRTYGWKNPLLHPQFWRGGYMNARSLSTVRHEAECQITGNQRGLGRLGGDFWRCVRNKAGRRGGIVTDRYPESYWHNLNIMDWFLAPVAAGPVGTTRLEMIREGVQECEARIAIESVLTNPAGKAKLGEDFAKRAQAFLDDQQRNVWRAKGATEEAFKVGIVSDYRVYDYDLMTQWKENAGNEWYVKSGWAGRVGQLYTLAAEVMQKAPAK